MINLASFTNLIAYTTIYSDAAQPWQLGFQDSAAPGYTGIVTLHNTIGFYLIIISITVFWALFSIVYYFNSSKNPISHKYLTHGSLVPIQKCSKFNIISKMSLRTYTTLSNSSSVQAENINFVKKYANAYNRRKVIYTENQGKSGIYMFTNELTKDIYIGQSSDLARRFKFYFCLSYIKSKKSFIVSRALIKYGYLNFSVTILEYCDKSVLTVREQYYLDKLNPKYNILKFAGSSLNHKHSEETKAKMSQALKGVYVKEKSVLLGRFHTEETKYLMSLKKKKANENNPFFGKAHKEETKELMRQAALGRKHSDETLLKMSIVRGNPVNIYEKCSNEGWKLIGSFVSTRRAANFLDISHSTVRRYMNSGEIFKDRYKFSSK
jgi:group I intron endonuclease